MDEKEKIKRIEKMEELARLYSRLDKGLPTDEEEYKKEHLKFRFLFWECFGDYARIDWFFETVNELRNYYLENKEKFD